MRRTGAKQVLAQDVPAGAGVDQVDAGTGSKQELVADLLGVSDYSIHQPGVHAPAFARIGGQLNPPAAVTAHTGGGKGQQQRVPLVRLAVGRYMGEINCGLGLPQIGIRHIDPIPARIGGAPEAGVQQGRDQVIAVVRVHRDALGPTGIEGTKPPPSWIIRANLEWIGLREDPFASIWIPPSTHQIAHPIF